MFLSAPKVKSYATVMESFRTILSDLEEVANGEESTIKYLTQQREDIDSQIIDSETEMNNCMTAISNIQNIFPNIS